jgi:putative transposase
MLKLSTAIYYYKPKEKNDNNMIILLKQLAQTHYRWGFWKMYYYLRNEGEVINHKRLHRIYTTMNLNLRSKRKKRLPLREKECLMQPLSPNIHWSMDFMQDNFNDSKKFRTLNIIDDFNREGLAIVPSKSITSNRVIMELGQLIEWRGKPERIRVDNGPEFIAHALNEWAFENGIILKFIQPGKPAQNGYIERFNRTFREEVLSMHLFRNLDQVTEISNKWIWMYNNKRPHCSLANLSPRAFLLKYGKIHIAQNAIADFPTFQQDINNKFINQKLYI